MRGLTIFLICMLLATGMAGCTEDDDDDDDDDNGGNEPEPVIELTIGWNIAVQGDNYLVQIISIGVLNDTTANYTSLEENGFKLLNENRLISSIDDPNGNNTRMEGDLSDIEFVMSDYEATDGSNWTNATQGTVFYADYPAGQDNRTLYIVYMDTDANNMLTAGDNFWIRSQENDGIGEDGYIFRLTSQVLGRSWGELVLPAVN